MYPNGDVYYGQHKLFVKEGLGKLVCLDGTIFEGNWENDRKSGKGRLIDGSTGDIYVGEFTDGKKTGRGRIYHKALDQIYEGEWSNDNKQGEGLVLYRTGRLEQGDFRAGVMEGKSQHKKDLSLEETERVF